MASNGGATLHRLARAYGRSYGGVPSGERFHGAFLRYLKRSRKSLLDVTLTAISATILLDKDVAGIDPRLMEAIQITSPHLAGNRFLDATDEQLRGAINAAKGKYFEFLVVDRLNGGEQVGPVVLPPDYRAVLADKLNEPGWDLRIVGPEEATVHYLQLKATDSAGYVMQALQRYPDIEILATHEVAHAGLAIDSGITEDYVRGKAAWAIDTMDDSAGDRFLDYVDSLFPLAAIASMEGYRVWIGHQSMEGFVQAMSRRGQRIVAAKIAGGAVYAVGGGVLAIPAAIAGGLLYDRFWNQHAIAEAFRNDADRLLSMRLAQQGRILAGEFR